MNSKWKRPVIVPISEKSKKTNVITLNEGWKINLCPPENFTDVNLDDNQWQIVKVPGRVTNQGIYPNINTPYVYRNTFEIPKEFEDNRESWGFEIKVIWNQSRILNI